MKADITKHTTHVKELIPQTRVNVDYNFSS